MADDRLIIEGGHRLRGTVQVAGAKNAALPCLAAALLSAEDCVLENVPDIADVTFLSDVMEYLGAEVGRNGNRVRVNAAQVTRFAPPTELVAKNRANFLIMGALLARFGEVACAPPGGDVIGQRPIDVHLSGFAALGAEVGREDGKITARAQRLRGARIFLDYPSQLGTENLLLAATLAEGTTQLVNAACEPEVVCLANLLNEMGARIRGQGTPTIVIEGVRELHGAHHWIIPDRLEAGTFALASAITGGEVVIEGAVPEHLDAVIAKLREIGAVVEVREDGLRVCGEHDLRAVSVQAFPYPGLPTDIQPPMAALLTQAKGVSYVLERVFENRMLYVTELRKMGAEIVTTGGTTAIISGPTPLIGTPVRALDIRAGAALTLAALVASGKTELSDVYHLDRGYERLEAKLRSLGAVVERMAVVS